MSHTNRISHALHEEHAAASWGEFCRSGQELCERMLTHVQKEEASLLPLLEDIMDAETESQLVVEYLESA